MQRRTRSFLRALSLTAVMTSTSIVPSMSQPIGLFDAHTDVGNVRHAGMVVYDAEQQTYTISGSGTNMWFDQDEFHYVWKRMTGDFILRAEASFVGEGVDPHRKIGWIIRRSLDTDSPYVSAAVHGDGLTSIQFRRTKGAQTGQVISTVTAADVIQLERRGDTYIMSVARFGEPFVTTQVSEIDLEDEVYVGLFVCAHNPDVVETAVFRNVRIVVPAWEGLVQYREYLGSNLEILDVETGHRRIVYRHPESLQAPNWTLDGEALIYNHNGRLYRFDLETNTPTEINTDFAVRNNNDHVLSFDGTMLGISHHAEEDSNRSMVYIVPVEGGTPKKVTTKGPSYLHGWSPDGRFLVYTGGRDGNYDIYKIPVSGGEEIRLTDTPGLDDGPEYAPDGEYIYFNSTRSGTMQLWRMRPDGSEQEQLTGDEYNNWFPHVSPDGQRIIFLSYPKEVDPGAHPFYQHVYLRTMPTGGGAPRIVAYLYGGQGTINVPSWSPDGRYVAFVSNTVMEPPAN